MKKIVIDGPGGYDKLQVRTLPDLEPVEGEIVVDVEAIGINYADCMVRMGLYESAKQYVGWPITPGFEVAGTAAGKPVVAVTRFDGYATQVRVPVHQIRPIPDGITAVQAATFPTVFLTAWYALHHLAHVRPGESILVHSAAGGVGSALCQLGKRAGCHVTGVVGGAHKVAAAQEAGADVVIDKRSQDLWGTAAPTYDVVLDANGVETLSHSYARLAPQGRLVIYGFHTMLQRGRDKPNWAKIVWAWLRTPRFNPLDLTTANKSVMGFNLSFLFHRADILEAAMDDLLGALAAEELKPLGVTEFEFEDVGAAHAAIESGSTTGKLALRV